MKWLMADRETSDGTEAEPVTIECDGPTRTITLTLDDGERLVFSRDALEAAMAGGE